MRGRWAPAPVYRGLWATDPGQAPSSGPGSGAELGTRVRRPARGPGSGAQLGDPDQAPSSGTRIRRRSRRAGGRRGRSP